MTVSALAVAPGCLSFTDSGGSPTETTTEAELESDDKISGEDSPVSVEKTVTDSDYTYLDSNDTVRYPSERSGGKIVEYGYEPFDNWSYMQGARIASRAVYQQLEGRLDDMDYIRVGHTRGEDSTIEIVVFRRTELNESGDVTAEPDSTMSQIAQATPSRLTISITFADRTAAHEYSVFVVDETVESIADETAA
jgi:hypothetical protein